MGTWGPGAVSSLFLLSGGCRERPLMLLKARMGLTVPDDEPLARGGTRCPRPGSALFGGRISHLIGRMLN